ncbi:replication protein RepA [Paracraurococcus lichenis]|uniref:Replication protein RepA n=1 Tax=Paracraurococcus lichenis TaxID=3064888 RepID=A0ABT9EA53_9PROT|nr:replication protein RepA [Paracraurococcus sp. LOR1-02]MDO9713083.1 replication protein RepA [Paracraurococcus sp. LOR1-02]
MALNDQAGALQLAASAGQLDLFERVRQVAEAEPAPSFLHSALCAMSLPVRRPADDQKPIIRQDGQYTLLITPKAIVHPEGGQRVLKVLGVPYGSLPRLILIHIMSEAVRTRSRQVHLGDTFTDWMRRMGFRTASYGPRGSATLVRQQLDRLLACEWMIRWDSEKIDGSNEFAMKELKLANEWVGTTASHGAFTREIVLTEAFHNHLARHAVPLNEHAIRQIRESATALDLYTWLAYRLPRISQAKPISMSWQQLAAHFGNEQANMRKFRQTVRDAWEHQVSAVYPEARAEFDTSIIRLHASPAPLQQKLVQGAKLAVIAGSSIDDKGTPAPTLLPTVTLPTATGSDIPARFLKALRASLEPSLANVWLRDVRLEHRDEGWVLATTSSFKADYIRAHFGQALDHAAEHVGLAHRPDVRMRKSDKP